MWPVSDAFNETLKRSHTICTKAEIYDGDTLAREFEITDGNVNVQDETVHRRASVTLVDDTGELSPADANSLFAPVGNEMRLYRGVVIPATGVEEFVPLGVFGLSDVRVYDSGEGLTMIVDAYDRARKVARAHFPTEYVVTAGTNVGTAIQGIISSRLQGTEFNFVSTEDKTPLIVYEAGQDPWQAARELAASIGCDLFFDEVGVCTLAPVPILTQNTPTVWDYTEGPEATFLYLNRRLTDDDTYSHVIVTGENNGVGAPVRGEAIDDNPSSPTYYLGKFGDVVLFEANRTITTNAQAQIAATALLQRVMGLVDLVEMQAIVNPAHDAFDVISIDRPTSKIDAKYIISKVTIPMTQDRAMNVSVRQGGFSDA